VVACAECVTQLSVDIRLRLSSTFELNCAFSLPPGFTVLFGPSGAGKTTVLDCISGLKRPDAGKISVGDCELFDNNARVDIPVPHRKLAYVFQDLALFPHLTVWQNVTYGLATDSADAVRKRAHEILAQFGIDAFAHRPPRDLSGGERQRVALARSLITEPRALLLDEPLAALDRATRSKVIQDLRTWNESHNVPILYVTHSAREAIALGGRALLMRSGRVEAAGLASELIHPDEWE
jgi:molybdate transport system ATP-binding protein